MGICGTSTILTETSLPTMQETKKHTFNIQKSIKTFDNIKNTMVDVPLLIPAHQSPLYSKRRAQSPYSEETVLQLIHCDEIQ